MTTIILPNTNTTMQSSIILVLIGCLLFNCINAIAIEKRQSVPPYSGSSSGDDSCHVEGAALYVRAVLTHQYADAEAIPTTENVTRIEGPPGFLVETAGNRQELIASSVAGPQAIFGGPLYKNKQPIYTVINSTTVEANYTIVSGLLNGTIPLTTAKIQEYFDYPTPDSCLIDFIEAIFYIGQT